jgi:tetraacyldisaccharide 4'-kinase
MEVPIVDGAVVAFCGIARPEQFFAGLEAAGVRIACRYAFRDHHGYTHSDLNRLIFSAGKMNAAAFVTTEKDWVRLGKMSSALTKRLPLTTAGLRIEIEREDELIDWLTARIANARRG